VPNIAFLSLIYLLFAVPGFLFRWIYFSGGFTRQLLPKSWTDEIGKALLIAIPFHLGWMGIFELCKHYGPCSYTVTYLTAFELLTGDYGDPAKLVRLLYSNAWYLLSYYVLVTTTACAVGYQLRKLVWLRELDASHSLLTYRNEWLYTIMGRGKLSGVKQKETVALIDILTDQDAGLPGKTVLYQGRALAFSANENGFLRNITLGDVLRAAFEEQQGEPPKLIWKAVPGDEFIVDYGHVRNINITYLTLAAYRAALDLPSEDEREKENHPSSEQDPPAT
jgi:hypothetical protein